MIHSLTGLRFFAAMWVVLFHVICVPLPYYDLWFGRTIDWGRFEILLRFGHHGVDLFFILSGFVMSCAHRKDFCDELRVRTYMRYMMLRFGRIYPLHLLLLGYIWGMNELGYFGLKYPHNAGIGYQLTLTHGWVPSRVYNDLTWNMPAWSISAEWFAYLQFPFGMWLLTRVARARRISEHVSLYHGVLLGVCVALAYGYGVAFEHKVFPWHLGEWGLIRVFVGFWIGVCVQELWRTGWLEKLEWSHMSATVLIVVGAYCWQPHPAKVIILVLCAALIFSLARGRGGWVSWILSRKLFVYLGSVSYGIYMLHFPVLVSFYFLAPKWCQNLVAEPSNFVKSLVVIGICFTVIVLSVPLYHGLEEPARRRFRWLAQRIDPDSGKASQRPVEGR